MATRQAAALGLGGWLIMLTVASMSGGNSRVSAGRQNRPDPGERETARTKKASTMPAGTSKPAGGGVAKSQLSLKPADVANPRGDGPDGKGNTADDTWGFWFQLIHARDEYRRLDIATASMPPRQRTGGIGRKVRGPIGGMTPNPKQTEGWIYHSDWDGRFEGFWGDSKTGQVLAHPYNEKTSGGAVAVTCRAPDDGTYRISGKITDVNVAKVKHRALTGVKWSLDVVGTRGPDAIVRVTKALKKGGPIGDAVGPASAEFDVEGVVLKKGQLIRLTIDPNKAWGGDMTRIDYFKVARVCDNMHNKR